MTAFASIDRVLIWSPEPTHIRHATEGDYLIGLSTPLRATGGK